MTTRKQAVITFIILLIILLLAVVFYFYVQGKNAEERLNTSPMANALSSGNNAGYTDINGNPVSLENYFGKTILALAWASWCPACIEQIQLFSEISSTNDAVVVLAFNRAEPVSTVRGFFEYYAIDPKVQLVMDPNDHFFTSLSGYAMPEAIIFDEFGTIRHHERGPISREKIEQVLTEMNQE